MRPSADALLDAGELLALEAGDPDHEEFVEIAARDGQEAQPLEQRVGGVARFLEHAAVERQPAQLAVEITRSGLGRRRAGSSSNAMALGPGCPSFLLTQRRIYSAAGAASFRSYD